MELRTKFLSGYHLMKFILFSTRKPIAARINLNNKCAFSCKYCNVWNTPTKEMSSKEVFSLIDQLKEMGTQRISFSGGEPLLRQDVGEIITYCKMHGISPSMNSTGYMLETRINQLKDLDLMKFSLDGNKKSNDPIRGTGSFNITMKAVEIAQNNNMRFSFATTLTNKSTNINNVKFMLELVKKYNTFVAFQPLKAMHKGVKNLSHVYPTKEQYIEVVNYLIKMKKQKTWKKHIRNSLKGLYHILNWPKYDSLKCNAGEVFIIINPNGEVVPCDRIKERYKEPIPNYLKQGLKDSFNNLPAVKCLGCGFCGALELNFLTNMKFNTLSEIFNIVR